MAKVVVDISGTNRAFQAKEKADANLTSVGLTINFGKEIQAKWDEKIEFAIDDKNKDIFYIAFKPETEKNPMLKDLKPKKRNYMSPVRNVKITGKAVLQMFEALGTKETQKVLYKLDKADVEKREFTFKKTEIAEKRKVVRKEKVEE